MAYKYGSFQQPKISSGYQYGGGMSAYDPNYVSPSGLAAARAQRNETLATQDQLWRHEMANSFAMRDQQRAYEDKLRADRQDARQRNVMGISPLADQLADPYSAAYQWTMEDGRTPQEAGIGPEMTIGDENGSAPAPLPMVRPRLGKLSRMVRPEFAEAQERLGVPSSRTLTTDEFAERERLKAELRKEIEAEKAGFATQRDAANNRVRAATTAAKLQASDATNVGNADAIANDMMTSAGLTMPAQGAMPAPAPATGAQSQVSPEEQTLVDQYKAIYPERSDEEILAAIRRRGNP